MRLAALILIAAAALYRIAAAHVPQLGNFTPLMALAFCGGVYFRRGWMWAVPFAALAFSDLYLDHYYLAEFGYRWSWGGAAIRLLCFAAGLVIGSQFVAGRRSWPRLLAGSLGASILFYLVTNTVSFLDDAGYAHTLVGWGQAMTVGHPQFPSTLSFFRNTLLGDLFFTGLFVLAMEYAALKDGAPSLLARRE